MFLRGRLPVGQCNLKLRLALRGLDGQRRDLGGLDAPDHVLRLGLLAGVVLCGFLGLARLGLVLLGRVLRLHVRILGLRKGFRLGRREIRYHGACRHLALLSLLVDQLGRRRGPVIVVLENVFSIGPLAVLGCVFLVRVEQLQLALLLAHFGGRLHLQLALARFYQYRILVCR